VAGLLRDPDPRVRFRAAAALLRAGDKAAVPVLTALLGEGPLPLAWQAEEMLFRVAGDKAPQTSVGGTRDTRLKARTAWENWWKTNAPGTDLTKINLDEALQGLNVVCECDGGKGSGQAWEFKNDGKPRWQIDSVNCPCDAQVLPGGRILLAEYQGNQVTERDRTGKILWTHRTTSYPTTCQRLPNGNTFIATYNELTEVTADNKTVYTYRNPAAWNNVYRALKLRNGHILMACSGAKILELDAQGKEVKRIALPAGLQTDPWASVEPLSNGRYLVGLYGSNKVIEIDGTGKVHWEVTVTTPSSASRLPNGHVLVSSMDAKKIVELDRTGKEVWQQATKGRPFRVRRY
jgi:outer membrane protein assembly factor BamB